MSEFKYCDGCKYLTYDMDGVFCGHPISFSETIYGRSTNYARRVDSFCGPERKLFEEKT